MKKKSEQQEEFLDRCKAAYEKGVFDKPGFFDEWVKSPRPTPEQDAEYRRKLLGLRDGISLKEVVVDGFIVKPLTSDACRENDRNPSPQPMNSMRYEQIDLPIKCATFDQSGISPEARERMDADRAEAERIMDEKIISTGGYDEPIQYRPNILNPLAEPTEHEPITDCQFFSCSLNSGRGHCCSTLDKKDQCTSIPDQFNEDL